MRYGSTFFFGGQWCMWYSFVPVPFVELAILSPLRCLCAFVQKQWNFLIVPCAFLLFVVQHCGNKRRADKNQTLWKINKTFNNLALTELSLFVSYHNWSLPISLGFTVWNCSPFPDCVELLLLPWLYHWLSCRCAFPQALPSA